MNIAKSILRRLYRSKPDRVLVQGFTLIELLVVISIIALLAAILFPVFARARENARRSSCLNNLKQLNLGIMQYVQDNDGYFPSYEWTGQTTTPPDGKVWTSGVWYWPQIIYPYTRSSQIYVCPDAPATYQFSPTAPLFANYGANAILMNYTQAHDPGRPAVSDATTVSPASTYLIMDAGSVIMFPYYPFHPDTYVEYLPGTGPGSAANLGALTSTSDAGLKNDFNTGRHFNGLNVGFADGHVKWVRSETVLNEAAKCPVTGNFGNPPVLPTQKSAWNPFVDNS